MMMALNMSKLARLWRRWWYRWEWSLAGLQGAWFADAPCWGLCSHLRLHGLLCREGKPHLIYGPSSRWSRRTLLDPGHFPTPSGGDLWLSLLLGELKIIFLHFHWSVFIITSFLFGGSLEVDMIMEYHYDQIWRAVSSVVHGKTDWRPLRPFRHLLPHSPPSYCGQQVNLFSSTKNSAALFLLHFLLE